MLQQELVALVKSSLAKPIGARSREETRACEELFRVCDPVIRAKVRRVHQAPNNETDDLVQDVWVLVMGKLPKWDFDPARGTFDGWVAAIAAHEAWRRARRRSKRRIVSLNSNLGSDLLDAEPGPDAEFERMQDHELFGTRVGEFAASLCECEQRIVMLHWVEACSPPKIATDLGVSEGTVRWVIRRTKPKLLDCLRRGGLGRQR